MYIPKEDAASPTVSTESMFTTSGTATSEKRYVRCYNVPRAFVNTDIDENMLMVLKGDIRNPHMDCIHSLHVGWRNMCELP